MMRILVSTVLFAATVMICSRPILAVDPRAQEVMEAARTAIGGEELLEKIQSLEISGQYRRMLGERQIAGDREISIQLPDKYLTEDAFNPGGMSTSMINTRGLNGEHAWNGSSGGGGGVFFRMAGPGGQQLSPEQMEALFHKQYQLELTRYLLALLVRPPSSMLLDYKYAGDSEVDDTHAEVVDVTGPDRFAVRIFFDKQSHLPLLLSYRGNKPRIVTMSRGQGTDIKKAKEEAQKLATEPNPQPEQVDFFIRLSDHKKINGLLLPHKLTFLTENEVSEEFEISKYKINPQFKSDKFEKH